MWCEEYQDKNGVTKYRFIEKYKDPLTDKWKRTSVVMNKNTRPSQKEAERRLQAKIDAKLNDNSVKELHSLTFAQAVDEWYNFYKTTSGSKPTTVKNRKYEILTVKRAFKDDLLISKMTLSMLQEQLIDWVEEGYSHDYIRSLKGVITKVIKYVYKYYNMSEIPFLNELEVPKKSKTHEQVEAERKKYLEDSELDIIYNAFDKRVAETTGVTKRNLIVIKQIIEFQVLNGLRIGELLALKNEDVDFDNNTLTIDGTLIPIKDKNMHYFGSKGTPKTAGSRRKILITSKSAGILKNRIIENKKENAWNDKFIATDFIFCNSSGSPYDSTRINKIIKEVLSDTSLKDRHITTHILRHTHISKLAQLNVPLKAIMERVGHSDHRTTLQIYSHVTEQMNKDMMSKLEAVSK